MSWKLFAYDRMKTDDGMSSNKTTEVKVCRNADIFSQVEYNFILAMILGGEWPHPCHPIRMDIVHMPMMMQAPKSICRGIGIVFPTQDFKGIEIVEILYPIRSLEAEV